MTVRLYRLLPLLVARNASNRQVSSIAGFRVEDAIVGKPFKVLLQVRWAPYSQVPGMVSDSKLGNGCRARGKGVCVCVCRENDSEREREREYFKELVQANSTDVQLE